MDYYRDSVTSRSWEFLVELHRTFRIAVIGGWAVWLYTRQLKSKDIDIIVELPDLSKLREAFPISKNERLKKYELRRGEIQVDVYAPFYSKLGVPAEDIIRDARIVDGFRLPSPELLLVLKAVAWNARRGSAKGRKDFLDMISLLQVKNLNYAHVRHFLTTYNLAQIKALFVDELKRTTKIDELSLNSHQLSRAKRTWLQL